MVHDIRLNNLQLESIRRALHGLCYKMEVCHRAFRIGQLRSPTSQRHGHSRCPLAPKEVSCLNINASKHLTANALSSLQLNTIRLHDMVEIVTLRLLLHSIITAKFKSIKRNIIILASNLSKKGHHLSCIYKM